MSNHPSMLLQGLRVGFILHCLPLLYLKDVVVRLNQLQIWITSLEAFCWIQISEKNTFAKNVFAKAGAWGGELGSETNHI